VKTGALLFSSMLLKVHLVFADYMAQVSFSKRDFQEVTKAVMRQVLIMNMAALNTKATSLRRSVLPDLVLLL
jgi:hypothetical protein